MIFLLAMILGTKLGDFGIYSTPMLFLVLFLILSSLVLQYDPKKWIYLFLGLSIALGHTTYLHNNLEHQSATLKDKASDKGFIKVEGVLYQKNLLDQKQSWLVLKEGGKVRLQYSSFKSFPTLESGSAVWVSGKFTAGSPARNPGGFDEKKWLSTKKACGTIYIDSIEIGSGHGDSLERLRHHLIKPVVETLLYHTALKQGPLAAGMLFGEDGWIEASVLDAFSTAGVNHILSVSGAHFAVLLFWVYYLLGFKECAFWLKKVLVWCILGAFIWLIGMDVAALRAYVMFLLLDWMRLTYKQTDGLNALCLTVSLLVLYNPYVIGDVGLQLAASAMYAIVVMAPFLEALGFKKMESLLTTEPDEGPLKKWFFKQIRLLAIGLNVSISVSLVLYPILRNQFNQFSCLSIIYNIPVSVISAISLPASVLCCVLAPFPFLARGAGLVNGLLLKLLTLMVETSELLPHEIGLASLSRVQTTLYLGVILLPLYFKSIYKGIEAIHLVAWEKAIKPGVAVVSLLLICMILTCLPTLSYSNQLRVFYLDVGQGDGSVIITPDQKVILMDTGLSKGRLKVKDTLLKLGIQQVDLMILSHPHDDHIGGATEILEILPVEGIALFKGTYSPEETLALYELIKLAKSKHTKINYWSKGHIERNLSQKDLTLTVLHPPEGFDSDNANDESLVCEIIYQKAAFLFTGDISSSVEYDIINQVKGDALIMKVPHHGSGSSSGEELLSLPISLGVIQVGQNNRYGHPNERALSRFDDRKIPLLRTDESGCITISTDGNVLLFKSHIQKE